MLTSGARPPFPRALVVPVLGVMAGLFLGWEPLVALAVGLAGGLSLSGSI